MRRDERLGEDQVVGQDVGTGVGSVVGEDTPESPGPPFQDLFPATGPLPQVNRVGEDMLGTKPGAEVRISLDVPGATGNTLVHGGKKGIVKGGVEAGGSSSSGVENGTRGGNRGSIWNILPEDERGGHAGGMSSED